MYDMVDDVDGAPAEDTDYYAFSLRGRYEGRGFGREEVELEGAAEEEEEEGVAAVELGLATPLLVCGFFWGGLTLKNTYTKSSNTPAYLAPS